MAKIKVVKQVDSGDQDSPWIRAGRQHDNTYLRLGAQVTNWRIFSFVSLVVATVAVLGMVYIGSQSKFIPVLVEVDKLGHTVAVRAISGTDAVADTKRLVYREMFDLIENLRTVTTDRTANNNSLSRGFSRLSGAAKEYVRNELKKAPPNEVGETKTVQIIVNSALKQTEKTWLIEWEEHSYDLAGVAIGVENWKASVQYDLEPSSKEQDIRVNPIGYTVTELNWTKVIKQ